MLFINVFLVFLVKNSWTLLYKCYDNQSIAEDGQFQFMCLLFRPVALTYIEIICAEWLNRCDHFLRGE